MARIPVCSFALLLAAVAWGQDNRGYYRFPAVSGNTIVFTSEGDLWEVGIEGGQARRLTTHPGEETHAAFSPDGRTIAFSADYEGPTEVYTMPAVGGLPTRRTFEGSYALVEGWTPDGKVLYNTRRHSTLPDRQLATIDRDNRVEMVPLSQASQGVFTPDGKTLFFTRQDFQGSQTKNYRGGTAQQLWKFSPGAEAVALTADFAGTSKNAMYWNRRVYFLSDRDGTMNIWSMDENGKGLRQHTHDKGWDAQSAALSNGRIVYQLGADLRLFDIASGSDRVIPIELVSDFDNLRERWVKEPNEYGIVAHFSHDGKQVALVSRGKVFVAPVKQGRFVEATATKPARFRDARLTADGKSLVVLSTESGEVEVWKIPANGVGPSERLTTDGHVLRWEAIPSPDGKWIVHQDKENQLWLLDATTKAQKRIAVASDTPGSSFPAFRGVRWSPDSRWIAFSKAAADGFSIIYLYGVEKGTLTPLTTDRYNSESASWAPKGDWLYFISDRSLHSVVSSPWGPRQPDPFFDHTDKIYRLALRKGLRSPFEPADELHPDKTDEAKAAEEKKDKADEAKAAEKKPEPVKIDIDLDGIAGRIEEVPAPEGNYGGLAALEKRLCWLAGDREDEEKTALECLDIANKGDKPETVTDGVSGFEASGDGKKMLVRKKNDFFVIDSGAKADALKTPKAIEDAKVDLKGWTFTVIPSEEFRELYLDAWRLHRDYFYDPNMNGVDWPAMRDKYLPLVDRVRDREELNDVIAQMVSELGALHTFVVGGDIRTGPDHVQLASLGAQLERTTDGYLVKHIYRSDPDRPEMRAPLARPGVDVAEGDVIVAVNGRPALSAADIGELLRNRAGKQVLLGVLAGGKGQPREVVVKPITIGQENDLRYGEWEYTRRLRVEQAAAGQIGYVHLRNMTGGDVAQWARDFYPVFQRQGLIIDVRHNGGGNIDSWVLAKLMRRAWFYWKGRIGPPTWNMQYAFRGYMVVLCDEHSASDAEAFSEGFRRLGLGKLIGTRTWGGEIWLTASNVLADHGIATAAEIGVYGPEGKWLIEGHGVEPDITVDNLPNATFNGQDAQLDAAVAYLEGLIKAKPVTVPAPPPYPKK
jgi:tricorn protease